MILSPAQKYLIKFKGFGLQFESVLILKTTIRYNWFYYRNTILFSCCMWVILPKNGRSGLFSGKKMKFILFEAFLAFLIGNNIWLMPFDSPTYPFNIMSWFPNFRWRNIPFLAVLSKNWDFIMFLAKKRKVVKLNELFLYHVINLSSILNEMTSLQKIAGTIMTFGSFCMRI